MSKILAFIVVIIIFSFLAGFTSFSETENSAPTPITEMTKNIENIDEPKEPQVDPSTSQKCDANYSDCVPIASDVDCSSGSGDGPEYITGPVYVLGTDIYKLDRDKDGVACE